MFEGLPTRAVLQNNPVVLPNVDTCYIDNLPPELLSRIFEVGSTNGAGVRLEGESESGDEERKTDDESDSDADISFPTRRIPFSILVSHVCHHWRAVACSTPSLWTDIEVDSVERPPYERVSMLLERSKGLPIDTYVRFDMDDHRNIEECTDGVKFLFSVLTPHVQRWRTMIISVSDYFQMQLFFTAVSDPSVVAAPQLTGLDLYYDKFIGPEDITISSSQDLILFGGCAPLLTRLALSSVYINWNQPWITSASNLKVLELSYHPERLRPSWAQFASILHGAPALEELVLYQSGPSGDPVQWFTKPTPGSPSDLIPIQLPHVTHFTLALHSEAYAIGLLRKLYLPALKELVLEFHKGNYSNLVRELARPVISPSPAPEKPCCLLRGLDTLEIRGLPCPTKHIEILYSELQNLTTLNLSLSWSLHILFLEILCTPCTLSGHGSVWLPRLTALIVSKVNGDLLRRLVEKRRDARVPLLCLRVRELYDVDVVEADWLKQNVKVVEGFGSCVRGRLR